MYVEESYSPRVSLGRSLAGTAAFAPWNSRFDARHKCRGNTGWGTRALERSAIHPHGGEGCVAYVRGWRMAVC